MWVKRYHMGMSFNCGRPMSTNTCTWVLFLSGACWLYELNARALCHSLLLSSASVCQRARKVCTQLRTQVRQFDCKKGWRGLVHHWEGRRYKVCVLVSKPVVNWCSGTLS